MDAGGIGWRAICRAPNGDVTVGDDAEESRSIADWESADIQLIHPPRGISNACMRRYDRHVPAHHLAHLHEFVLICDLAAQVASPPPGPRQSLDETSWSSRWSRRNRVLIHFGLGESREAGVGLFFLLKAVMQK